MYLAIQAVKEQDDEAIVIALVGQEQTLLRQHDYESAFCRWVRPDSFFALLVHLKVIQLLPSASLPQLKACVLAKNLLMAGSSQDLGRRSWPYQRAFDSTNRYPLTSPILSMPGHVSSFSQACHSSMVPVLLQPA